MPAAMLLSGCATVGRPPAPTKPQYVYMVLHGGKFRAYPIASALDPEVDVDASKLIGAMCLKPDDWGEQEAYILELEAFAGIE